MSFSTSHHKHRLVIDLCDESDAEADIEQNKKARPTVLDSVESIDDKMEKHWDSVIKLTPYQTPHKARLANTIQFQSILQLSGLQQALMSSMVVDWPWLLAQLPASVPLTIVKDWDRSHEKPGHHSLPSRRNVTVIHPPFHKNIYGKMHAKLMLLFYRDTLRVVISSANLLAYDYHLVQNIVFLQDFPLRHPVSTSTVPPSLFLSELKRMLVAMTVPAETLKTLDLFDFTKATARIVSSIPGDHDAGHRDSLTGLNHLKAQLECLTKELHLDTSLVQHWCLEYQCSSLGASKTTWLKDFIDATVGAMDLGTSTASKTDALERHLRIIFPSLRMVTSSAAGPNGFLTVFLSKKHYQDTEFPKKSLCQSLGRYDVISLHTKILSLWLTVSDGNTMPLFNYLGSHNFSAAAWGTCSTAKGHTRLFVRNFEIGILVPGLRVEPATGSLCPIPFPYPYQRPPLPYAPDDMPWMQSAYRA